MIDWVRIGRDGDDNGTTTYYCGVGTPYTIQSRKRHIPHASRGGYWDHTTYWVVKNGEDIKERYSLADAKEYVEQLMKDNPEWLLDLAKEGTT